MHIHAVTVVVDNNINSDDVWHETIIMRVNDRNQV